MLTKNDPTLSSARLADAMDGRDFAEESAFGIVAQCDEYLWIYITISDTLLHKSYGFLHVFIIIIIIPVGFISLQMSCHYVDVTKKRKKTKQKKHTKT